MCCGSEIPDYYPFRVKDLHNINLHLRGETPGLTVKKLYPKTLDFVVL